MYIWQWQAQGTMLKSKVVKLCSTHSNSNLKHLYLVLVVDRVLGPVLAQGSTATSKVKPERLARQNGNDY